MSKNGKDNFVASDILSDTPDGEVKMSEVLKRVQQDGDYDLIKKTWLMRWRGNDN